MSDIPRSFSLDPEEEEHANDKWPGPSKTWTTREQWRWLKETRTPYLAAQRGKKLAAYLEEMHREYFVLWPECKLLYGHNDRARLTAEENDALNDAVKKRKEQLRNWHKNRDRNRQSSKPLAALLADIGATKKTTRLPQAREMYSKERYKDEIRPVVLVKKAELEAELGRKWLPGERLNIVKKCTDEAYNAATMHVKRDIGKKLAQAKEDAIAGRSGRALLPEAARTPQQYQDAIDMMPQLLGGVLNPLGAYSGWTISVVGAGPVPEDDGKIGTISAHFGHDPTTANFAQSTADFEEKFVVPVARFAKSCFPRDVQKARSLEASRTGMPSSSGQADNSAPSMVVVAAPSVQSTTGSEPSPGHVHGERAASHTSVQRVATPSPPAHVDMVAEEVSSSDVAAAAPCGEASSSSVLSGPPAPSAAVPEDDVWRDMITFDPNGTEPLMIDYSRMDNDAINRMVAFWEVADPNFFNEYQPPIPGDGVSDARTTPLPARNGVANVIVPDPLGDVFSAPVPPTPTHVRTDPSSATSAGPPTCNPDPLGEPSSAPVPKMARPGPRTRSTTSSGATIFEQSAALTSTSALPATEPPAVTDAADGAEEKDIEEGATRRSARGRETRAPRPADDGWAKNPKNVPAKKAKEALPKKAKQAPTAAKRKAAETTTKLPKKKARRS